MIFYNIVGVYFTIYCAVNIHVALAYNNSSIIDYSFITITYLLSLESSSSTVSQASLASVDVAPYSLDAAIAAVIASVLSGRSEYSFSGFPNLGGLEGTKASELEMHNRIETVDRFMIDDGIDTGE